MSSITGPIIMKSCSICDTHDSEMRSSAFLLWWRSASRLYSLCKSIPLPLRFRLYPLSWPYITLFTILVIFLTLKLNMELIQMRLMPGALSCHNPLQGANQSREAQGPYCIGNVGELHYEAQTELKGNCNYSSHYVEINGIHAPYS